ncbi:MAG: hypothetical protein F6K40_23775 [Okeania sp. SIO3I5]|uniref:hypothetical protein n=1 Tax=Okeania sp. SIO3I5 TaxID=2607805 RepID=UPI0013B86EFC|nr:hypothetical protein [Okeania sp. SIO3I5]NEQ39112.1 hypothetical protein [Okeania sp. SIO3I5]
MSERQSEDYPLIFQPIVNLKSSLYVALDKENLVLFQDFKKLKPLSVNAFRFNQQFLIDLMLNTELDYIIYFYN